MLFEAKKKTALVAYLLWFFVGMLGGHNFYLKRTGVAVTQLILSITVVGLVITVFWVLVDAFLDSRLDPQPKQPVGDAARSLSSTIMSADPIAIARDLLRCPLGDAGGRRRADLSRRACSRGPASPCTA